MLTWARRWYVQARKNRIDTFYREIGGVSQRVHDAGDMKVLAELESDLADIRRRAADELIHEQLAADSSYIVFQNMLVSCQTLLERTRGELRVSPDETFGQPKE